MSTNETKETEAREALDAAIETLFIDLAEKWKLPSGDWAPDQEGRLTVAKDQIVELIMEWEAQNRPHVKAEGHTEPLEECQICNPKGEGR